MNNQQLILGQKTDNFPFGYGHCQCGCGAKTYEYKSNYFNKYIPFHSRKKPKHILKKYKLDRNIITKELLVKLYLVEKKTLKEIADAIGCSDHTVINLLNEYSIKRRNLSKARLVALKKGKIKEHRYSDINESFFNTWSPEMAWILGLLYTDGYMKGNSVRLAMNDHDVIEKYKHHLCCTKEIKSKKKW